MRVLAKAAAVVIVLAISPSLLAQWPKFPVAGGPKTADGKPDLDAPAPRAADGKPDLSGVWEITPGDPGDCGTVGPNI